MATAGRLIVICGLPGAGKTTLARKLAQELSAIRLCPDDWMMALAIDVWDAETRARVEAFQWTLAQGWLAQGYTVIIEWGVWARQERDALRMGARAIGASVELRFLDAPVDVLFERVRERGMEGVAMTIEQLKTYDQVIERPDAAEIELFDPPASLE